MTWKVELSPNFQMGSWENRIVRRKIERHGGFIYEYGICEVMYTKDHKIFMCTEPKAVCGETMVWLRDSWFDMLEAFRKPVLDYDTDIETAEAAEIRNEMLPPPDQVVPPTDQVEEEQDVAEFLKEIGLTQDQFFEKLGVEDSEEDTFDPVEYCRSHVVECDRQEKMFEKFHGKRLREIFEGIVQDRIKEEQDENNRKSE